MSVDPFVQAPGNSQSMNPYSYIMNNPLGGTDPSGYLSLSELEESCPSRDDACRHDRSIADTLKKIEENGYRSNNQGVQNKGSSVKAEKIGSSTKNTLNDYTRQALEDCESNGCPDYIKKMLRGKNQYPNDAITLPQDNNTNVIVRISPSTGEVFFENPDGTISTSTVERIYDDGVKNGAITVGLAAVGGMASIRKSGTGKSSNNQQSGEYRASIHSSGWQSGSLKKSVNKLAGTNPKVTTTKTGKTIYTNRETGVQVVHDKSGNYFRIRDPNISGKRSYLDINGRNANNKTLESGKQMGRTQSEYNQATHFSVKE